MYTHIYICIYIHIYVYKHIFIHIYIYYHFVPGGGCAVAAPLLEAHLDMHLAICGSSWGGVATIVRVQLGSSLNPFTSRYPPS